MPSSAARRSRAGRISPIPAATSRGAPAGRRASRPIASTRVSTPFRGHELAHVADDRAVAGQAQAGAGLGGRPGHERAACRRRWAPSPPAAGARRAPPRRPAIVALTAQTWSIAWTACDTRPASRGSPRGHVQHVGAVGRGHHRHPEALAGPRRRPPVGHQHVGVDHVEGPPEPCTAAQGPVDGPQHRVGVAMPQPGAGKGELARVEHRDAVDHVARRARRGTPASAAPAGAPSPWGRPRARRGRGPRAPAPARARRSRGPVHRARVHVAQHQDADGDTPRGSCPPWRASTSAPIPRPNMIHIGAKWIAVDGPRLPVIQPISDSAPARDM